jgi:anthranilate synthase/aminodeoxychorismate synthase-like glutamine amidotransferase
MKIALIDNYDSFTFNLFDYIKKLNTECVVFRNDSPLLDNLEEFDAFVFSPGPQRPEKAGRMMDLIKDYVNSKPMLGVCLGHQALALHFGANLVKAEIPVHGKTSRVVHNQTDIFENIENPMEVMRYHSLIVKNLPQSLDCTARTFDSEIMAIKHKDLAVWGVQFHPESVLTTQGINLIKNWINIISKKSLTN